MDELKFRDVRDPKRLKAVPLDNDDMLVLGRDQGAGVGTDLDGNQWPTQLHLHYDAERDVTVVLPKGPKNKIQPYRLGGIIRPADVRQHFLTEFGPQPEAMESEAAEIVNVDPTKAAPVVDTSKG